MKAYNRIMAGQASAYVDECISGGFIGVDFDFDDLTGCLLDKWQEFNERFIPVFLAKHPGKSRIAAGLACGFTWTLAKRLN